MNDVVSTLDRAIQQAGNAVDMQGALQPRGMVHEVGDGVALIIGLPHVGYEELLQFDSGALGMAFDLRAGATGAVLLAGTERVGTGDGVVGLGRLPDIPVGEAMLGRLIDPLGNPLDSGPDLPQCERLPLFRPAPEIIQRKSVDQPLLTGTLVVDGAIPIGRGQRELIVGDRNIGKTALALDFVAAQRRGDVACVYVMIGQPMTRVLAIREMLREAGSLDNTVLIAADAAATPGMQYLAPYAGASAAEWFRDKGADALVVYDDLTKHADTYRQLALLLDRPPGREAYPGDIFYIHAELLERATACNAASGGGSVTAFPIVETTENDIAAYIPTNLISITDGQIYLETTRFERDQRPAVDIGRSVSRIGAVAQPKVMRAAARNLRILMSRFESLESLTRVGLDIDATTQGTIRRGRLMRELLRQGRFSPRDVAEQVVTLTLVNEGWLDAVDPQRARAVVAAIMARVRSQQSEEMTRINQGEPPATNWLDGLQASATSIIAAQAGDRS
jgi:F-type H+-transporting ATPase subunit alpha